MSTPPLRAAVSSRTRPVAAAMVAIAGWWVWGSAAGSRTPAAAAWVPASALDAAVPQRVTEAELWLAPPGNPAPSALARAIDELAGGRPAAALPIFEANVSDPALSGYARLYVGRANLALHRPEEAARAARQLLQTGPAGYLDEAALWLLADACEATGNWAEAVAPLRTLTEIKSSRPGLALFRLGRAAEKSGDSSLAAQAYSKVYYDFPLSDEADDAGLGLSRLSGWSADRLPMELARAQQLFTAKKFSESRKAYEALRPRVSGDDRGLVDLRVAECDVSLQRYPAGRDGLRAYMNVWSTRLPEAEFYYLAAERGLGREAEYVAAVQAFVENHPASPLAETA